MDNQDGTKWDLYDSLLRDIRGSYRQQSICSAVTSFSELAATNPAFQASATRNGSVQPILAQRTETNICKISILPNDTMCIGDIIECYNEHWIVVELYTDEYGLTTGVMWLCNYELSFQNGTSDILKSYCVIDDGSYSKTSDKSINTAEAQYTIYIPLNQDTDKIYVDKRFGIGVLYNQYNEQILQTVKTTWVDKINQNYGEGSHMLKLKVTADLYNAEKDDINTRVCDYIEQSTKIENVIPTQDFSCVISGKDSIRIGGKRTYTVSVVDKDGVPIEAATAFRWTLNGNALCKMISDAKNCTVSVPLDESLIGEIITLSVCDENNTYEACDKEIRVVTIG